MKAVIYHADGPVAKDFPPGTYENIFRGFRENLATFGIPTIHLTLEGHPGWGDENYYYPGDPAEIVYNREVCFCEFLRNAPDDVYWFSEPDSRVKQLWPKLTTDVAMLRRQDSVAINPCWRLARPSALPLFERFLQNFELSKKTWHGDSHAMVRTWEEMGEPGEGIFDFLGIKVELRNYNDYATKTSMYSQQFKSKQKLKLISGK